MVKEGLDKQLDYSLHVPKVSDFSTELKAFQVAKMSLEDVHEKVMKEPTAKRKVRLISRLKHWIFRVYKFKTIIKWS